MNRAVCIRSRSVRHFPAKYKRKTVAILSVNKSSVPANQAALPYAAQTPIKTKLSATDLRNKIAKISPCRHSREERYTAKTGTIAESTNIEPLLLPARRKESAKISTFPLAIKMPKVVPSVQAHMSHSSAGCVLTVFCINIHHIHSLYIHSHITEYAGKHTINRRQK